MAERPDLDAPNAAGRIGRRLGTWRLERVLGSGGMATVYAAVADDGARAALKVLHPEMSRREELRHRFAREASAASRVEHPGAVKVLGSGEEPDGTAYLVLELLDGESLGDILRREGALPLSLLLDVLDQVLDVLAVAHARGIVHRDLKPDNLFVLRSGRVKVLDFGIARLLEDAPGAHQTRLGVTLGTVPFMSPEQARGKRAEIDGRSDLFSLGALSFRAITERNVHEALSDGDLLVAMASKAALPLATIAPRVPDGLAAIVDVALAFSRDARYPDAATMQADVRALARGEAPPYATRLRRSRDMATRTDLAPPAVDSARPPAGSAPRRSHAEPTTPSPSPSPSASVTPLAAASPDSSDLWPEPLSERAPPSVPVISSRRVVTMPARPDPVHAAVTVPNPVHDAVTVPRPMHAAPADEVHVGPLREDDRSGKSRAPLWIGGLVVAVVGAGAAYYLAQSASDGTVIAAPPSSAH